MCVGYRPHLKPGASIKAAVNIRVATLDGCAVSMPDVCLRGCCINAKHTIEVPSCNTHSLRTKFPLPALVGLQTAHFVFLPALVASPQRQIAGALKHAVHDKDAILECPPHCPAPQGTSKGHCLAKQTLGSKVSSANGDKGCHVFLGYSQRLK